jgi:hypothetical protein
MSMFSSEDSSSKVAEFLIATDIDWISTNVSYQAVLRGQLGRWFPRDSVLNCKPLSIKTMKQSRAIQRSGTILSPLSTTIASATRNFWVTVSWLLYDNVT